MKIDQLAVAEQDLRDCEHACREPFRPVGMRRDRQVIARRQLPWLQRTVRRLREEETATLDLKPYWPPPPREYELARSCWRLGMSLMLLAILLFLSGVSFIVFAVLGIIR
jgi:hypothetical protein